MTTRLRRARPIAVLAVAAATVLAIAAPADARGFTRLPAGKAAGEGVTIIRSSESVRVGKSLAHNGLGRTAWVSGNVRVVAPGIEAREAGPNNGPRGESEMPGSNGASTTGAGATTTVLYVVGCQVSVGGLDAGINGSLGGLLAGGSGPLSILGIGGTLSLPLAPGEIKYAMVDRKQLTKPGTYYFNWRDAQMDIQGCGGYAQARSLSVVETTGNNRQKLQLWGRPFSIG